MFGYLYYMRIGFESYRLYPDLMYINEFLHWMFNIELFHFEEDFNE